MLLLCLGAEVDVHSAWTSLEGHLQPVTCHLPSVCETLRSACVTFSEGQFQERGDSQVPVMYMHHFGLLRPLGFPTTTDSDETSTRLERVSL